LLSIEDDYQQLTSPSTGKNERRSCNKQQQQNILNGDRW